MWFKPDLYRRVLSLHTLLVQIKYQSVLSVTSGILGTLMESLDGQDRLLDGHGA